MRGVINIIKALTSKVVKKEQSDAKIIILCAILFAIIYLVDTLIPLGVAGGVPYIAVVLVSLWSRKRFFIVTVAIIGSLLTVLGFYTSPVGGELWKVLFNRALALFAIWTTAILSIQRKIMQEQREHVLYEREKAISELNILEGLLPICASCKKIRDDAGYWNQIESYISEHSEADFTHGLCPECVKILYDDLELDKNKKEGT